MKILLILIIVTNLLSFSSLQIIDTKPFDYSEKDWPSSCRGNRQSPINFPKNHPYIQSDFFQILSSNYTNITNLNLEIRNFKSFYLKNIISNQGEIFIKKNGTNYRYTLSDVHFHILSEHTFDNISTEMEMHMVHLKDLEYLKANNITESDEEKINKYLVVGTLFRADSTKNNTEFQKFNFYSKGNVTELNLRKFANEEMSFFHYIGGLTTPSCDEIVNWVVNVNPISISYLQYLDVRSWISTLYPNGNQRNIQNLNNREIYFVEGKKDYLDRNLIDDDGENSSSGGFLKGNFFKILSVLVYLVFVI